MMDTLELVGNFKGRMKNDADCKFYYVSLISDIANCICRP